MSHSFTFILTSLIMLSSMVKAQEEPYNNKLTGRLKAGDSCVVTDEKFKPGAEAEWTKIEHTIAVRNLITFTLNDTTVHLGKPFKITLDVKLVYEKADRSVDSTDHVLFTLDYDTAAGSRYKSAAYYKMKDYHRVKVIINSISSQELGDNIPPAFLIRNQIFVERKYYFEDAPLAVSRHRYHDNQLDISWDAGPFEGAESFDLEYTFFDTHSKFGRELLAGFSSSQVQNGRITMDQNLLEPYFRNNSSRINTSGYNYMLNLPYRSGFILYRIRSVQLTWPDGIRRESGWCYSAHRDTVGESGTYSAIVWVSPSDEKINRQYTATFAEEGKRKEIMRYFDGTLRARQAVTINNSDNKAVVQETVYDALGRGALEILPAPADDVTLHYYRRFNIDSALKPYSFKNIHFNGCLEIPDSLSSSAGTSQYYSTQNTFLQDSINKYIPAAGGYPFSFTQFRTDNTNRPLAVNGPGVAFHPDSNHAVRYYYGKPTQRELDRMFGVEAGDAQHYQKVLTRDANRQFSIAYINASGKTVATALAGNDYNYLHDVETSPVSSPAVMETTSLVHPENIVRNAADRTVTSYSTFMLEDPGDFELKMEVAPLILEVLHGPGYAQRICNDCYYDVRLRISNDCGVIEIDTTFKSPVDGFDTTCASRPAVISLNIDDYPFTIGTHYAELSLKVSEAAMVYYDANNFAKNTSLKTENDFKRERIRAAVYADCVTDCETRAKVLNGKSRFTGYFLGMMRADSIPVTVADSNWANNLYDTLAQQASSCATSCTSKHDMMIIDVSPGGQYALFDSSYRLVDSSINVLRFYRSLTYKKDDGSPELVVNEDGDMVSPAELTLREFIMNWRQAWAAKFVTYHPEYCYYRWCMKNAASEVFDESLYGAYNALEDAVSAEYFIHGLNWSLLDKDPFFNLGGLGYGLRFRMLDSLMSFSQSRQLDPGYDIFETIHYLLYCGSDSTKSIANCPAVNSCRMDGRFWLMYRQFYLELKQKFVEEARMSSAEFAACTNCYIGNNSRTFPEVEKECYSPNDFEVTYYERDIFDYIIFVNLKPGLPPLTHTVALYLVHVPVSGPPQEGGDSIVVYAGTTGTSFQFATESPIFYVNRVLNSNDCDLIPELPMQEGSFTFQRDPHDVNCWQMRRENGVEPPHQKETVVLNFADQNGTIVGARSFVFNPGDSVINQCSGSNGGSPFLPLQVFTDSYTIPTATACNYTESDFIFSINDSLISAKVKPGVVLGNPVVIKVYLHMYPAPELSLTILGAVLNFNAGDTIKTSPNLESYDESMTTTMHVMCISTSGMHAEGYPSECPDNPLAVLYRDKRRIFNENTNSKELGAQIADSAYENRSVDNSSWVRQSIAANCDTMCTTQADEWMARLKGCNSMSPTQYANLRLALINVCSKGCDSSHMYGSSTISPDSTNIDASFQAAIIRILGPGAINDSCTAYLISHPYPYSKPTVYAGVAVNTSNSCICTSLSNFKGRYNTAVSNGFTGSFHAYMESKIGSDMQLTAAELADLERSCNSCGYELDLPLIIPAALSCNSGCIDGVQFMNLQSQFEEDYPNADTTSLYYEDLYRNYFNHYLGYSLSYTDYYKFRLDTSGTLCNQSLTKIANADPFTCLRETYNAAIADAVIAYRAYADSVSRDFREQYLGKCMNIIPALDMSYRYRHYHFTLYYYDQAGNLVKTIPPAGFTPLSDEEVKQVERYRLFIDGQCSRYSDSIRFSNNASVRFWAEREYFTGSRYTMEAWVNFDNFVRQGILSLFPATRTIVPITGTIPIFPKYDDQELYIDSDGKLVFNSSGLNRSSAFSFYKDAGGAVAVSLLRMNQIVQAKKWVHIAISCTDNAADPLRIYVNGQPIGIQYTFLNTNARIPYTHGTIDRQVDVAAVRSMQDKFRGSIKQVRLYGRVLSPGEIRRNADDYCMQPSNRSDLRLWAPMDSAVGNIVMNVINQEKGSLNGILWTPAIPALYPKHSLPTNYVYNSLNQVTVQTSPDAGTSRFWYDRVGRLVVSQNAKQAQQSRYSYTLYDAIGRITEVGEKRGASAITGINTKDAAALATWLSSGSNYEVTLTRYDAVDATLVTESTITDQQSNLRKRVVSSLTRSVPGNSYDNATHYSYDISGNVKSLWQEIGTLRNLQGTKGIKRIDYDYDLASGKVNKVLYQQGKGDQFFQRFSYDADNRVTGAFTSRDGLVWQQDARYHYYLHGPLSREELGDKKVQGIDYAYTLQGWLKGINGTHLTPGDGMTTDGVPGTLYSTVARDVLSLTLGYYNGDYHPIGGHAFNGLSYIPPTPGSGSTRPDTSGTSLYNGNISHSTLSLSTMNSGQPVGYTYGYDRLNRLRYQRYQPLTAGDWSNISQLQDYREDIRYDGNGNILNYLRHGTTSGNRPLAMDKLSYFYIDGTNQLSYVDDGVSGQHYREDMNDQRTGNYAYDAIGNLIYDRSAGLSRIDWTVYGKISTIYRGTDTIRYGYDAGGHRVSKYVSDSSRAQFYVRDAQGNTLAVYDYSGNAVKWQEQHLYGTKRLGIWYPGLEVADSVPSLPGYDSAYTGRKTYELSNHLGNVLTTISDKKISVPLNDSVTAYYVAEVLSQTDYYPFGMLMPGRGSTAGAGMGTGGEGESDCAPGTLEDQLMVNTRDSELADYKAKTKVSFEVGFKSGGDDEFSVTLDENAAECVPEGGDGSGTVIYNPNAYHYGFNGKENDNEIKGEGNQQDYGLRIYDPRLGKFLSVDPITKEYPELTPYQFASNRPIDGVDQDGLEWELSTTGERLRQEAKLKLDVAGAPARERERGFRQAQANGMAANLAPTPQRQGYDQKKHEENRVAMLNEGGFKADGSKHLWRKIAENKTFKSFADNLALPILGMAVADGVGRLLGIAVKSGSGFGDAFIASATKPWGEQGLTVVGRALQKHAGREGSVFQGVKFSHKTANDDGLHALMEIINSSEKVIQKAKSGGQYIFDKNTGRGFGVSRDGMFNGFRELNK